MSFFSLENFCFFGNDLLIFLAICICRLGSWCKGPPWPVNLFLFHFLRFGFSFFPIFQSSCFTVFGWLINLIFFFRSGPRNLSVIPDNCIKSPPTGRFWSIFSKLLLNLFPSRVTNWSELFGSCFKANARDTKSKKRVCLIVWLHWHSYYFPSPGHWNELVLAY